MKAFVRNIGSKNTLLDCVAYYRCLSPSVSLGSPNILHRKRTD
jgi:hypothetical protein